MENLRIPDAAFILPKNLVAWEQREHAIRWRFPSERLWRSCDFLQDRHRHLAVIECSDTGYKSEVSMTDQ